MSANPSASPAGGRAAFLRDLGTIPNLVSIARVVLIYVSLGLFHVGLAPLAVVVGVLAGLSDYLDGYLARRLRQSTRIGGLLDQAADVLFIVGVIFMFVLDGTWPPVLAYVVLFRETIVLNLRASAAEMGFGIPSIFLGKWSSNWMFWSLAVMGVVKARLLPDPMHTWAIWASHGAMVVGVVSSVATGVIYLGSYARRYVPLSGEAGPTAPQVAAGGRDQVADGRDRHDR